MRAPVRVVVAVAAVAVGLSGCTGSVTGPEPGPPAPGPDGGRVGLVAFDSCESARQELIRAATPYVGPYGLVVSSGPGPQMPTSAREDGAATGSAAAAPATPEHSTTTVQEAGVDEPDVVKTDGRRLVSVVDGRLRVVDLTSRAVTTVPGLPQYSRSTRLLLYGDRALVVAEDTTVRRRATAPTARFVLVDLAAGRVLETLTVPASFVDGRQVGGVARLVLRSTPEIDFVSPGDRRSGGAARAENRRILAGSSIDEWLPRFEIDRGGSREEGRLVDCAQVSRPAAYSGASMLTVLTVDLAGRIGTGDAVGIVADGDTVYGTATSLYVAARARPVPVPVDGPIGRPFEGPIAAPRWQPGRTEVHAFELPGAGRPRYVASGSVPGWLLNQYSLSEHDGRLRVATTVDKGNGPDSCCDGPPRTESGITVLARQGRKLVEVGRLDGLGKGERIYAVRFLGPVGYVVTFRQTDPLYTVDLSDPAEPRLVGELKIPGYSAYLHPTGASTLLGVGQDATDRGRRLGTQVSLFDVGDPAQPRRTASYQVTDGRSEVEFDPRAFLWWPKERLAVLPVQAPDGSGQYGSGALVLRVGDGRVENLGTVRHPAGTGPGPGVLRRALVVGDTLWTVSDAGARAVAISDLSDRGWVPFS